MSSICFSFLCNRMSLEKKKSQFSRVSPVVVQVTPCLEVLVGTKEIWSVWVSGESFEPVSADGTRQEHQLLNFSSKVLQNELKSNIKHLQLSETLPFVKITCIFSYFTINYTKQSDLNFRRLTSVLKNRRQKYSWSNGKLAHVYLGFDQNHLA